MRHTVLQVKLCTYVVIKVMMNIITKYKISFARIRNRDIQSKEYLKKLKRKINDLLISDPEIDNYEASAKGLMQPALAPNTIYNLPEQEDTNESPDLTEGTCTLQKDVSTLHTNLYSEINIKSKKDNIV